MSLTRLRDCWNCGTPADMDAELKECSVCHVDNPCGEKPGTKRPGTSKEHAHPDAASRAGCPACHPDKTVPELNAAYRAELARTSNNEEVTWLADVEKTARSVIRQNKVLPYKPVELAAEEVLRLVAGYRRAPETVALHDWLEFDRAPAAECQRCKAVSWANPLPTGPCSALKANACQCDPNPSIGGSPPCPVHDGESEV